MKPFTSSVLSIKESTHSPQLLDKVNIKKSPLIRLLEFDEAIAQNDLESTRAYYMSLLKYSNNPTPRNEDGIYSAIFNQYESVKTICYGLLSIKNDNYVVEDYYTKLCKLENNILNNPNFNDNIGIYTTVKTPGKCHNDIIMYPIIEYTKKILKAIELKNFDEIKDYHNLGSDVCNHVASAICGDDTVDDIDSFIDAYKNAFSFNESKIPVSVAISMIKQGLNTILENAMYTYIDGATFNHVDSLIRTLQTNADMIEDPNIIRTIVQNICDSLTAITIIDTKANEIQYDMKKSYVEHNISIIMHYIESKVDNFSEAMSMFGDAEIDASNVFDLLDDDEFNHSYYMDLALVAQHEMTMNKIRAHKEALIQEAIMIAEGTADMSIIEAGVKSKIGEGLKKVMELLKSTMDRFKESLLYNIGQEKEWLTKNKNVILNNGFAPDTKITFHCNVNVCISGEINKVLPPAISYQQLKQNVDAFTDENSFFETHFKKDMPGFDKFMTKNNIKADESIANKCKWYFGAKLPNNGSMEPIEFSKIDMVKMYDWMFKTVDLAKETEKQLRIIEQTVENYQTQANIASTNSNGEEKQSQETSESFIYKYGELLAENRIITEKVDVEVSQNKNQTPPPSGQAQSTQQQNSDDKNKEYKQSNDKVKEEIKNSGDEANIISGRMEIYLKTCDAVLKAKATAIMFVHNECLSLMRAIVKGKLGNSADIKLRSMNPNDSNKPPKQQDKK